VVAAVAREQDRQANGKEHEEDRCPGRELGQQVGRTARTEGGLRTLAAEGTGQIGRLALLEQNDPDEEEANDDMDEDEKVDHRKLCDLEKPTRGRRVGKSALNGIFGSVRDRGFGPMPCGASASIRLNPFQPVSIMDECITEFRGTQTNNPYFLETETDKGQFPSAAVFTLTLRQARPA
jgi:hypothetical protein